MRVDLHVGLALTHNCKVKDERDLGGGERVTEDAHALETIPPLCYCDGNSKT